MLWRTAYALVQPKMDERWSIGVWLGTTSSEHIVSTEGGITMARSIRVLPESEQTLTNIEKHAIHGIWSATTQIWSKRGPEEQTLPEESTTTPGTKGGTALSTSLQISGAEGVASSSKDLPKTLAETPRPDFPVTRRKEEYFEDSFSQSNPR